MNSLQLSLTGPARPDLMASLTELAAQSSGVEIVRLEAQQRGSRLVVALRTVHPDAEAKRVWTENVRALAEGSSLQFDERPALAPVTDVVTLSGPQISAPAWAQVMSELDSSGCVVRSIRPLHHTGDPRAFEIEIDRRQGLTRRSLYLSLRAIAEPFGLDIAVQADVLDRTHKRLIVMDMDSTLIRIEVIDELARKHGVVDKVSEITRRAMAGELDFEQSLRERVGMLEGLREEDVMALANELPLMPGAERMLAAMQYFGAKTAVLSGGFTFAANRLKERLGLDYAHANELEIVAGRLTGKVLGKVVTPERKAELLNAIAKSERIPKAQILAVGDGANDGLMLAEAGLGVAFHAKAKLRESADTTLSSGGLDRLLHLMGLRDDQVDSLFSS